MPPFWGNSEASAGKNRKTAPSAGDWLVWLRSHPVGDHYSQINYDHFIEKIEENVNTNPDIAIESCKALLEGISKFKYITKSCSWTWDLLGSWSWNHTSHIAWVFKWNVVLDLRIYCIELKILKSVALHTLGCRAAGLICACVGVSDSELLVETKSYYLNPVVVNSWSAEHEMNSSKSLRSDLVTLAGLK